MKAGLCSGSARREEGSTVCVRVVARKAGVYRLSL